MNLTSVTCLLAVSASAAFAAADSLPVPVVADKVTDRFVPAPYRGQKMGGVLGERMRINLDGRLLHVDEPALLAGFQKRPGSHPWIGEHIGKFLHAAANTWQFTGNAELKSMMDRMVPALIKTQLSDGYLGTYTDDQRWTSWDVWSHKYNLIGLLSYYQATGYAPALEASRKIGDLMVRTFGDTDGKRDLIAASTHVGMAASSILEPMCQLYRYTGERRYLDFAEYIVRSWEQPNGPKIISSLLATRSVYRTANAKAYEMMSDLVGVVELYRLTGEPRLRTAAEIAWDDIRAHHLYVTGTTSAGEHFQEDGELTGYESSHVGEGCATVTWLQLSWQLLRITGEAKYAEELERTVYNQLLGAQDPHSGNICYFTPLIGTKRPTPGINCCVSSEPRGISMIPQLAWGTRAGDPVILLYGPGEVTLPAAKITMETSFPEQGHITMRVDPAKPGRFALLLRVPGWTSSFRAEVNGDQYPGSPGEYLTIERNWKRGDQVVVEADVTVTILKGGRSYPGFVAVQRGPQVLALDTDANPGIPFLHLASLATIDPAKLTLRPVRRQAWAVEGKAVIHGRKRAHELILIPFADAHDLRVWISPESRLNTDPVPLSAFAREEFSSQGHSLGSIVDGDSATYRDTIGRRAGGEDWYAVMLEHAKSIRRVVFVPGPVTDEGGGFEGMPRVEVQRVDKGPWEKVGDLAKNGTRYEVTLSEPVSAVSVRVIGTPHGKYSTCAELAAY